MTIREIYHGSDGEATKALYARLAALGSAGEVALNVFRAVKCSARAKVYRGGKRGVGSYRSMAYDRKNWSMSNLCEILTKKAEDLLIPWGWREDPEQEFHKWVLYVDLPTGQVSFHSSVRGKGPDYAAPWDARESSESRTLRWVEQLLGEPSSALEMQPPTVTETEQQLFQ